MIKINAYAKINLSLKINNKRPDGYHDIESIMQEINLYDEIYLETNPSGIIDVLSIGTDEDIYIPWNEKNLSYKAAKLFLDAHYIKDGLTIKIKKNIPTSAGLGGGSSDAAATLIGVNKLWKINLPKDRLAKIGQKVGSDVPFFLYGKTALVTGKGEKVSPLTHLPKFWLVLIKPQLSVSTQWAYKNFDLCSSVSKSPDVKQILNLLELGDKEKIAKLLFNDFEKTIFKHYPLLKDIRNLFLDLGALNSLLSGSGSVVFGICNTLDEAKDIYAKISLYNFGKTFLCSTI